MYYADDFFHTAKLHMNTLLLVFAHTVVFIWQILFNSLLNFYSVVL